MKLRWLDPPCDYRDACADAAEELHDHPWRWALVVLEQRADTELYQQELEKYGLETRLVNAVERSTGHPDYRVWVEADLYARSTGRPKEIKR